MSKHARRGDNPFDPPTIERCLFHRCTDHENVPQLNACEEQTQSECAACIAEELIVTKAQLLYALDGYAERMAYSAGLRKLLDSARGRLNLMQPGAGDFLTQGDTDEDANR